MNEETDALMSRFRELIYQRLTASGKAPTVTPNEVIKDRSDLYERWRLITQENGVTNNLHQDLLRHWVVADVTSYREVADVYTESALYDILRNISTNNAYAEILKSANTQLFERVHSLPAQSPTKAPENEKQESLDNPIATPVAIETSLPSDWTGKISIEPLTDSSTGTRFSIRALRKNTEDSIVIAMLSSEEEVKALSAHLKATSERWFAHIVDPQEANGLASNAAKEKQFPTNPENVIAKLLESVTYKAQKDGSVLYLINEQPAFVDHGQQILMDTATSANENEDAILAAILLAKEKYGAKFEVTGSDEFKRRAIEVIVKHNIAVDLKQPQQAALRREIQVQRDATQPNVACETGAELIIPIIGRPASEREPISEPTTPLSAPINPLEGTIKELGAARYHHDEKNNKSFYVTLENQDGEQRTTWGVDLGRLAGTHSLQIGDKVKLENLGQKPVTVQEPVRDTAGNVIGHREVKTFRNEWSVDVLARMSQLSTENTEDPKISNGLNDSAKVIKQVLTPSVAFHLTNTLIAVPARDWWRVQFDAAHLYYKDSELLSDLATLGPEPAADVVYWFDHAGRPTVAPSYEQQSPSYAPDGFTPLGLNELRMRGAISSADLRANVVAVFDPKESLIMTTEQNSNDQNEEPKLMLRGVKKLDNGEFDTTVLLFKGKGDYLQGFVKIGDQKHQVIAHLNKRSPDQETGEVKPNFIILSEPHSDGDNTKWKEIGFGNAVNRRKDSKPVFFDEVLFSVGNEVVRARVTNNVDDEMHHQIGFQGARKTRQKIDTKDSLEESPKAPTLSPMAQEESGIAPAKSRTGIRSKA